MLLKKKTLFLSSGALVIYSVQKQVKISQDKRIVNTDPQIWRMSLMNVTLYILIS